MNLVSLGKDFNYHYFGDTGKLCVFKELVPHALNEIINAVIKGKWTWTTCWASIPSLKDIKNRYGCYSTSH